MEYDWSGARRRRRVLLVILGLATAAAILCLGTMRYVDML